MISNKLWGHLIIQLMRKSESQEYTEKRFKFLADLTQNTGMDDDDIKFIMYQKNEDMDVMNSKSI